VYPVKPVPPLPTAIVVAFHTPVPIVPIDANELNVVTAVLTNVPDVGNVTFVEAVVVKVKGNAPAVTKFPPSVIVEELATPVPPFAGANNPDNVTAPVVAEFGVSPVVPALNDVTLDAGAAHVGTPPVMVKISVFDPILTVVKLAAPFAYIISPAV